MEEFIKNWVSELIDNQSDLNVLKLCGQSCALNSGMIDHINEALKEHPFKHQNMQHLYEYLKTHVSHDHELELKNQAIYLRYNFKSCVCPVMNHHNIQNEKACGCTVGFLQHCLQTVWQQDYSIEILDSFIKNNKPCHFKISL